MIDNSSYRSHNTARPGRARHAAPTRRGRGPSPRRPRAGSPTPLSASTPDGPTSARCGAWTPGAGPPRLTTPRWPSTSASSSRRGRAPATAALAVAAVRFRATLAGQPAPAGEATPRTKRSPRTSRHAGRLRAHRPGARGSTMRAPGPSDAAAPRNRARATRAARGPRAARRRPFGTCRDMAPPAQTRA